MANVLHHPIDFHPRPVSHAPSPFGFGFGLASSSSAMVATGWQPTSMTAHSSAFQQFASSASQQPSVRTQKRRHEPDDDTEIGRQGTRDASMDRSPTPERPKRAAPKRARVAPALDPSTKNNASSKENKAPTGSEDDEDVDVGMLLASLPAQSLLELFNSMLKEHPSLKSTILPLIPRPTLDTAVQVLAQSAKKLRDAYPYSNAPSFSQSIPSSSGFGKALVAQNVSAFGSGGHINNNGGMRDSYIVSRIRPYIAEFVATYVSYLPYFTSVPAPVASGQTHIPSALHRDKSPPHETFLFLSAVTNHLIAQPPLTQSSLAPLLLPRLSEEWKAWIFKVDQVVNREGGMFGIETVRTWERVLDEWADGKGFEGINVMRAARDMWISKVGWLTGRTMHQQMEEL